jgi:hypothetical protein
MAHHHAPKNLIERRAAVCRAAGALLLEADGMRDFTTWVETLDSASCPALLKELLLRDHTAAALTHNKDAGGADSVVSASRPSLLTSAVSMPIVQGRAASAPSQGRDARPRRCFYSVLLPISAFPPALSVSHVVAP